MVTSFFLELLPSGKPRRKGIFFFKQVFRQHGYVIISRGKKVGDNVTSICCHTEVPIKMDIIISFSQIQQGPGCVLWANLHKLL